MSLVMIVLVVVLVGVGLYVLDRVVPMAPEIKLILRVVVILVLLIWLLSAFGLIHLRMPR